MLSQHVVETTDHVGEQLGVGSGQPRPPFDHGDEALFENLKGNAIEWSCCLQRILVPGISEPTKPPLLAIIGYPTSLPSGRGTHPLLVAAPPLVLVARAPLPGPRGRPRLPLVTGALPFAPVGIDAVAPGVAEAAHT